MRIEPCCTAASQNCASYPYPANLVLPKSMLD
jgi:hypothetical protein